MVSKESPVTIPASGLIAFLFIIDHNWKLEVELASVYRILRI